LDPAGPGAAVGGMRPATLGETDDKTEEMI
jgi:hypothetical protein